MPGKELNAGKGGDRGDGSARPARITALSGPWRDREAGQHEVFVQDPDGYLLTLAQNIGESILAKADGPRVRNPP